MVDPNYGEIDDNKKEFMYEKHKWYAITVTLDDQYQYWQAVDRFKRCEKLIFETLLPMLGDRIAYRLFWELSCPVGKVQGKGPRWHLHGYFCCLRNRAVLTWLTKYMPNLLRYGMIYVREMNDFETWNKYCQKMQHIIREKPLGNLKFLREAKVLPPFPNKVEIQEQFMEE